MKAKFIDFYMDIVSRVAELSTAVRLKVGCVIVRDNRILSYGYNGTPTGWDNSCESVDWMPTEYDAQSEQNIRDYPLVGHLDCDLERRYRLVTKPEVMHAEMNSLMKISRSTDSSEGADLFCTHAPCLNCAKAIYQAGINTVYYRQQYRSTEGLEFLEKSGVTVNQR
jgi:dCMP deaminase